MAGADRVGLVELSLLWPGTATRLLAGAKSGLRPGNKAGERGANSAA